MTKVLPKVVENRFFVDLEEEDIQKLNREEAEKFDLNPEIPRLMHQIENEIGAGGRWEEHWLTTDVSGRRVYTRIYYTEQQAIAITADGRIIREMSYPQKQILLH